MNTDKNTTTDPSTALLGIGGLLLLLGVVAMQREAGTWLVLAAMGAAAAVSLGSVLMRRRQAVPAVEQAPTED